jgi:RNA-directed DNA polymerase
MHPDKEILISLKKEIEEFLKPIGLELHPNKTRLLHTLNCVENSSPGFSFLGFDIIQRNKWVRMRKATTKVETKQTFITLITPSKEVIKRHKIKLREIIRSHRGASQERLIQKLNPIIRGYALSKRTQISSRIYQDLDAYLFMHLWKWAKRRHPKMSQFKLKDKYWHSVNNRNWVFGIKSKTEEDLSLQLQYHSKIPIKRHAKVKGSASPFNGDLIYFGPKEQEKVLEYLP